MKLKYLTNIFKMHRNKAQVLFLLLHIISPIFCDQKISGLLRMKNGMSYRASNFLRVPVASKADCARLCMFYTQCTAASYSSKFGDCRLKSPEVITQNKFKNISKIDCVFKG